VENIGIRARRAAQNHVLLPIVHGKLLHVTPSVGSASAAENGSEFPTTLYRPLLLSRLQGW